MTPGYPDDPAGSFPAPPRAVSDAEGRRIEIAAVGPDALQDLVGMYERFDPADRAQGIPPVREPAIRTWLETVLADDCLNVVARHEDRPVGHATLVSDEGDAYELAIFVLSSYQGAGIGTELLETLLGHGQAAGVERVWLTVERWNEPAIALYESVGFEAADGQRFEREMAIRL